MGRVLHVFYRLQQLIIRDFNYIPLSPPPPPPPPQRENKPDTHTGLTTINQVEIITLSPNHHTILLSSSSKNDDPRALRKGLFSDE